MGIEEWYIDESKKIKNKEVTAKSESTSGVKFDNMDSDFTTMTSRIQDTIPKNDAWRYVRSNTVS